MTKNEWPNESSLSVSNDRSLGCISNYLFARMQIYNIIFFINTSIMLGAKRSSNRVQSDSLDIYGVESGKQPFLFSYRCAGIVSLGSCE